MRLDRGMSRARLGSVCALSLLACTPATGGLGTFGGVDDGTESGDADTQPDDSAEAGSQDGDGDPTSGDGDPTTGDGDPGPTSECGNGIIEAGEDCEGADFGGATCTDFGYVGGDLGCTGSCMIDVTKCWNEACGNGVTDEGEDCDGRINDPMLCIQHQLGPGEVMCTQGCTYDFSDCGIEGEGANCGFNSPCPNNQLECVFGTCYDGSYGDPCGSDGDCISNDCDKEWFEASGNCL